MDAHFAAMERAKRGHSRAFHVYTPVMALAQDAHGEPCPAPAIKLGRPCEMSATSLRAAILKAQNAGPGVDRIVFSGQVDRFANRGAFFDSGGKGAIPGVAAWQTTITFEQFDLLTRPPSRARIAR